MRAKCHRRWVSSVAIAAIAFAQFAVALHTCPVQAGAPAVATVHTPALTDAEPCAAMGGMLGGTQGNACETHCGNGVVTPAQPDLPEVWFAVLAIPPLTVATACSSDVSAGSIHVAASRAPPLTLRFCRLLI